MQLALVKENRQSMSLRSLQLLYIFLLASPPLYSQSLLEDFSTLRLNGGTPIWQPYVGPNQVGGLDNGMYKLTGLTQSSDGYGLYLQFLPYPYVAPNGFAQNWIKSGTSDPNANRLTFRFKCDHNMPRDSSGSNTLDIGTYVKIRSDTNQSYQGQHYYHGFDANIYAGRWVTLVLNRRPTHMVGNPGGRDYPDDPEWVNPTTGAPVHYFNGLTRFYFALYGSGSLGTTCWFDDFYFDTVPGEPDALVSALTGTHSGSAYEVAWSGPKNVNMQFDVRYATQSMKAAGFTSGTDGGTVSNPGSDYTGTFWKSPNMTELPSLYVAIRPRGQSVFSEIVIPAMNSSPTPSCDVNTDGVVNIQDVQVEVNAALGIVQCGLKDLDGNGVCDVVDVQRVANAALGMACRIGP